MLRNSAGVTLWAAGLSAAVLGLASCAGGPSRDFTAQRTDVEVHSIGTMRATIWDGELTAKVSLDELRRTTTHLYAVGPLETLAGEFTIIDGAATYSEVTESGPRSFDEPGHGAPFVAYASVPEWDAPVELGRVGSLAELEATIAKVASESGLDTAKAFPVLVEGLADSATIHVVNHRSMEPLTPETHEAIKVSYSATHAEVRIVGFYSTVDRGVFVHHDRSAHLHLVTTDNALAGHLDGVALSPGARLFLPKR